MYMLCTLYVNNSCKYKYIIKLYTYNIVLMIFYVITLVNFIEFHWNFQSSWCSTHTLHKLLPHKVYKRN